MFHAIERRRKEKRIAGRLCAGVAARAREPAFFLDYGVADTFDGRFDVLVLHASLVLVELEARGARALAQELVDALFARLEEALREQGAGDMSIARRMKAIAGAFYGRVHAYRDALDENALEAALLRNVYRGRHVEAAARLARYVLAARARLARDRLEQGELVFGPAPEEFFR